jgi:Fe-S-cluster containining protein
MPMSESTGPLVAKVLYGQGALITRNSLDMSELEAGPPKRADDSPKTSPLLDLRMKTTCSSCINKCCSQPYDWVYLTDAEVSVLAAASRLSPIHFVQQRRNEETGLLWKTLALPCPFLEASTGQCTVYDARPLICRLFPIYPEPLTGHVTLMPAQCGSNLTFPAPVDEGWTAGEYDTAIRLWVRQLWSEAKD